MQPPSYTYISSPYSDPDATVRELRYRQVLEFTSRMLSGTAGQVYFSPIVHCHEMAKQFGLPPTFTFWRNYNFTMLRQAERLLVLALPGWEVSLGVNGERAFAAALNIPEAMHDFRETDTDQIIFAESAALDK